jgi:L-2,4-diaminobutyrate decarboxylase
MQKFNLRDHFIVPTNKQKKLLKKTLDSAFKFSDGSLRDDKFLIYKNPKFFKEKLDCPLPLKSKRIEDSFKILDEVGKYSIAQFDLNYLSFPDSGNSLVAMIGTIYSKFLNQNLISFDRSAPIATFIEIQLIEWLRELIGYESKSLKDVNCLADVSGMWTTGGHMSNHVAVLSALNKKFPSIKEEGLANLDFSPVILLSKKISHYSLDSAVHHLGLGKKNIIDIPVNGDFTTNFDELKNILNTLPKDKKPFMVISVAGNTRTSSLDNLTKIATFCQKHSLWNHVDACHGGSLLFSEKLKSQYLEGIDQADSVAIDPHKGLFVTYPSSYILFKERNTLSMFSRYQKECYDGSSWDLGFLTPFFGSRGFESLGLWLFIKIMGTGGMEKTIEYRDKVAKFAEKLIIDSGYFITLNKMDFYRMAFVFFPKTLREYIDKHANDLDDEKKQKIRELINKYDHIINQDLYESGNLCLDEYKLHDVGNKVGLGTADRFTVFAVTIGNPLYTKKTITKSMNFLFKKAKAVKKNMVTDFLNIVESKKNTSNHNDSQEHALGPAGW